MRLGGKSPEMWPKFGYSIVTVFEVQSALGQAVYGEKWKSNLSLYCTADSATVTPVEQQSIVVLHSRQCHSSTNRTAIYRCTAQQTVPL